MESKIVKNLFITGELINITGYSGGYNMQFAFSTGAKTGSFLRKKFRT
jgi:predicted flavoprotein YhiN